MKAIGVIPARYGSTRLPGKSLLPLAGKPLVAWVVQGAQRARRLDAVVVATDDARIVAAVEEAGGEAVMTRVDHPSGTDRIAEAAQCYDADVVINIQGDEPMIDPGLIDALVGVMERDPSLNMATAATRITTPEEVSDPGVVKVVCDDLHHALYFSRSPIPFVRDPERREEALFWRHLGIYAYRTTFLKRFVAAPPSSLERLESLEQLRAVQMGERIYVMETEDFGIGVDTPEDLARAEALLREREGSGS
jgi:3-deoxy-manno-octulosonate cytidylyltransferase (CMP-KDO synthetase)